MKKHIVPHLVRGRDNFDLLHKDLAIVADTARTVGVPMPLAAQASASLPKR